jgi:hypothetical protein
MFIKPARENLIVRDPQTFEPLPSEGKEVGNTNFFYWKRRILDGDVIEISPENLVETNNTKDKNTKTGGK